MTIRVDEHDGSKLTAEENSAGVLLKPTTLVCEKPWLQVFDEAIAGLPADVVENWPADGAEEHDHYLYGTPKKCAD